MRKLVVFNNVTLDGYFADVNGDMSWAHKQDAEWTAFVTEIVVNPVVLGKGKSMFDGIQEKRNLKLTKSRTFGNGNVLLCYEPTA